MRKTIILIFSGFNSDTKYYDYDTCPCNHDYWLAAYTAAIVKECPDLLLDDVQVYDPIEQDMADHVIREMESDRNCEYLNIL